ncbi:NUDIX domain-containing protein [Candidatus Gracilibacteria bacterium]|nr:NUDIX domain-containing protein [Candidatus Gracilibacteria bacterium]
MIEQNIEVDINDSQIGLRPRDDFYTGKYIHRSSHLILFNSKNEILLQHRTPTKKWYPNLFTYSVSGTVANESYEECIEREMQEEIGISINVKRLFTYPFFDTLDKAWRCVFIGKTDDNIIPDAREIQEIKWMDADELKRDILKNSDIYSPPFVEGMKKYFNEFYGNEKQIRN